MTTDALPLSQRIRADLERQILAGELRPGDRIPVEHELASRYGCARMTVTRATEALANAGLIVRRKRAGSFVAEPRVESAILDIPNIQADIAARGMAYRVRLIARAVAPPDNAEEVELAGGGDLLRIDCLHLGGDQPFVLEHRLISLAAVPTARDVDFTTVSPGSWLLDHVAWTQAEHRISACAADAATAGLLGLERGAPCLHLARRTWRGDTHITRVRQIFPARSFDLVARFGPGVERRPPA